MPTSPPPWLPTESTVPPNGLAYTGGWLDRAGTRRTDPAWVDEVLAQPQARIIPLWRDRCLVDGDRAAVLARPAAGGVLAAAAAPVLLGLDGAAAVFAADLSDLDEAEACTAAAASGTADLRGLVPTLAAAQAAVLAQAKGMLHWHRHHRYCGACGAGTDSAHGGGARMCTSCGRLHFPRIEPAVIALVESPGPPARCLLGRPRGAADGAYATLAGFVEVGEGLEDAVRREVAEETGVTVGPVTYQGSQAWPFPSGLMVGFRARALTDEVVVDESELAEARWFTRPELAALVAARPPRHDSIERYLIAGWLADGELRARD
ncbi:MAG TPA: NAD(+) diphosphatase [Micromonosporaceae bacterium]|nr:NAD(+) diphosphatase [Micromonosporaceae bacterium]